MLTTKPLHMMTSHCHDNYSSVVLGPTLMLVAVDVLLMRILNVSKPYLFLRHSLGNGHKGKKKS